MKRNYRMLDEKDDVTNNESSEKVDNVLISDLVIDRVGFNDVESTLVTLKQFLKQRPTNATPLM